MLTKAKLYPDADQSPSFPAIEQEILEAWRRQGTFEKQVAMRPRTHPDGSSNEFVFYDGPPFRQWPPSLWAHRHQLREGYHTAIPGDAR
jgi:isoleucyl-tRNA synthetase